MALQRTDNQPAPYADDLISRAAALRDVGDLAERRRHAIDLLWAVLGDGDPSIDRPAISWVGFYEIARPGNDHGVGPGEALLLREHRNKPACSPIEMHGACGQSFLRRATLIVRDVKSLGEGYVACDPAGPQRAHHPGLRWG